MKQRKMKWAGHVARIRIRNILVGTPEERINWPPRPEGVFGDWRYGSTYSFIKFYIGIVQFKIETSKMELEYELTWNDLEFSYFGKISFKEVPGEERGTVANIIYSCSSFTEIIIFIAVAELMINVFYFMYVRFGARCIIFLRPVNVFFKVTHKLV
jgi:hypothetical protein